jgi:hypothetical protein
MTQITINTVSGSNFPYTIYVCDVYGSNCVLVSTILGTVPPTSSSFILPPPYNAVPALMLKVIDNIGCETYKIIYCGDVNNKQFMTMIDFNLMDGSLYQFEYQ